MLGMRKAKKSGGPRLEGVSARKIRVSVLTLAVALVALAGLSLFAPDPGLVVSAPLLREPVRVPIIMYHSILKDESASGPYVITPRTFERDLTYLRDHGYETVFIQQLIDYIYEGVPLPEKPVVITLDDGFYNNYVYVLPILEKLEMKAVLSVVGEYAQMESEGGPPSVAHGYMTWEHIAGMAASEWVEIANHSYGLHQTWPRSGSTRMQGETREHHRRIFLEDVGGMQDRLVQYIGTAPRVYTYPFGFVDEYSAELVRQTGFLASMSCYERMNVITDTESLYGMGRFNRGDGESTADFMARVLQ